MMSKTLTIIIGSVVSALPLLVLSFVISFLIEGSQESLGTVLFIVGGILIVFFSPGLFSSSSSGALHTPVVVYRLVNTLSAKKRTSPEGKGTLSGIFSSPSLVLAGVLLWAVSYFV